MDRYLLKIPETNPEARDHADRSADDQGRPIKKVRLSDESHLGDNLERDVPDDDDDDPTLDRQAEGLSNPLGYDDGTKDTAFENAALEPRPDETIGVYEATSGAQTATGKSDTALTRGLWVKGQRSIYVDAFNLALDTVLEDEAHLFDERERYVFDQWKALDYESQYLYVRLFLRKSASWHRVDRLGYYSDISDMAKALSSLQDVRPLPEPVITSKMERVSDIDLDGLCLGDSFAFADSSDSYITTVEDAVSLLGLDELKALAKEQKIQGRNKAEISKLLCQVIHQQAGLTDMGIRVSKGPDVALDGAPECVSRKQNNSRVSHFLNKVLSITGPCIRISEPPFNLFQRVHLVFYRSTEWTEKSLTTIILSKMSRRNFADYLVCRTSNIFPTRSHILEFEAAIKMDTDIDSALEGGDMPNEEAFQKVIGTFETIYHRWKSLVLEEQTKEDTMYEYGEGAYLRRFTPAHTYTRVVHKAAYCFGRLKEYKKEYDLLTELLAQKLFHTARRGSWYQRKALLEEHYLHAADTQSVATDEEQRKRRWRTQAVTTCETGLQDVDCHLIFHHGLQKRLVKLEKWLKIPRRLQHDFGHVRLQQPIQHTAEGIQIKREGIPVGNGKGINTKTTWVDEREGGGECSVEEMCLSWYRSQGWKGYHAEGGIIRTLFAYLFFDIIFAYVPNVFQTAYQTCPLDLHTDSFYPTRISEINRRLAEISNGEAERILRGVFDREHERRTCVVGLKWDFDIEDLAELVRCFPGPALAAVCKVMAQEYRQRGGGIPDLILWRTEPAAECMFAEVKSANDRLSDTQRLWIHVLMSAGVEVALCNAVATEVRIAE